MLYAFYFYIGTFRSMCAVSNKVVFCNSRILCFPAMLLGYILNDFAMVPFGIIIISISINNNIIIINLVYILLKSCTS